uniref:Protein OS-9 homolog n=1 Tax=Araucaria cunninghamii TaxID=56994 RepID=A0A0D6R9F1_ARACU
MAIANSICVLFLTASLCLFFRFLPALAAERIVSANTVGATFSHSNHDPKYNIKMHSGDAYFRADPGQESIMMADGDGQRFECFLPKIDENKDVENVNEKYSSSVTLATDRQTKTKTPDELLEVMKDQCFLRHEGWWSYEFCYKAQVRQVHIEDKKLGQQFILGVYDKEATAALHRNSPDVSLQKDPRSKTAAQRYHAHIYTNGTICDLTNEPRETEVRFMCSESNRALIQSIKEISTCKYALIVQCPMLCKHPLFQEERPTWYNINCNALSNDRKREETEEDKEKRLALPVDHSESDQVH